MAFNPEIDWRPYIIEFHRQAPKLMRARAFVLGGVLQLRLTGSDGTKDCAIGPRDVGDYDSAQHCIRDLLMGMTDDDRANAPFLILNTFHTPRFAFADGDADPPAQKPQAQFRAERPPEEEIRPVLPDEAMSARVAMMKEFQAKFAELFRPPKSILEKHKKLAELEERKAAQALLPR